MVEFSLNTLDDKEWWFDLGISYSKANYHEKKHVFTIALVFFTFYFRW